MFGSQFRNASNRRFGGFKNMFSPLALLSTFGRSGASLYRRQGITGKLIDKIPAPLKAFGVITGIAAATVVIAPGILVLAVPPLICGTWWLNKQRRALKAMANQMHDQRWRDMASYHLQQSGLFSSKPSTAESAQNIPTAAKLALIEAVKSNEQGLTTKLGLSRDAELDIGELQALSQDFRMNTNGVTEQMSVAEYPVYGGRRTKGIVKIVSRGGTNSNQEKTRIEVMARDGSVFVLDNPGAAEDIIIEGHGNRVQ